MEPFTFVDISKDSEERSELNLIPLFFQKKQKQRGVTNHSVVLVDLACLEKFVAVKVAKGVDPLKLVLMHVQCNGGHKKDFPLTQDVWIGSMMPRSASLRTFFVAKGHAEACRTAALKELITDAPRLFDHLLFWVDDLQDFEEAQWRLDTRFEAADICQLMSPYYFTEPEARYLGNFFVEGSANTLKDMLNMLVACGEEICTKNDVVPVLERTFQIKKEFQKSSDYKEKRAVWMKETLVVCKMPMGHD